MYNVCIEKRNGVLRMARPKKDEKDKTVRQSVSMDPEQLRQVIAYCQLNERTIAWVVKKGIEAFFREQNTAA